METTQKELSLGEKRVRINFNVSGDSQVDNVKRKTADLINLLDRIKNDEVSKTYDKSEEQLKANSGEKLRLIALAMTDFESACQWTVKAITAE